MCYGCWKEYGQPIIDTSEVRAAAQAIHEVYVHSCVGGNLHVVVDDWNVEDGNLAICQDAILNGGHEGCTAEQLIAEQQCLDILKRLSTEERVSALALEDGFWGA